VIDSDPELVEQLHEGIINHEGDGHVEAHPAQTRHRTLVESAGKITQRFKNNIKSTINLYLTLWVPHFSKVAMRSLPCSCICAPPDPVNI
jgi:hypothetical protein